MACHKLTDMKLSCVAFAYVICCLCMVFSDRDIMAASVSFGIRSPLLISTVVVLLLVGIVLQY